MSLRIIRIQLDRALEFAFSGGPVAVVIIPDVSERDMRLGEAFIDLYGFLCCGFCFWHDLVWPQRSARIRSTQKIISIGHAAVSQRKGWILCYRLLIILKRLLHSFIGAFVVIKSSFQIKLISLVAFGVVNHHLQTNLSRAEASLCRIRV